MNIGTYGHIALSSIAIYIFIIVAIRIFGKKELAQLSVIDLVFILLISNAVQNAMVGSDSSLEGGLISATALFLTNFVFKYLLYKFPKFNKSIQGEPVMLIYQGKANHKNMAKVKITEEELKETLREHGVSEISEVDLAVIEIDGNVSVISEDYKKRTTKKRKVHKVLTRQQ